MNNKNIVAPLLILMGLTTSVLANNSDTVSLLTDSSLKNNDKLSVSGLSLEPSVLAMVVGQEKYVSSVITPTKVTNKTVTFQSSDTSIVTVTANGEIRAKSPGKAIILATTAEGNFTSETTVKVKERLPFDENKVINLADWDLHWSDEFDYPNIQLDEKWISQNGSTGNVFVLCSRWRENAVVHDGILELKAVKESRAGQDWTCGNIWTKRTFKYGYFEAKYKYAGATGTNNSFWLWPKTDGVGEGKKAFEIDINEGHYPNEINTNIHNWTDQSTLQNGKVNHFKDHKIHTSSGDFSEEFHTYGYAWDEHKQEFYVDGKLVRVEHNDQNHSATNILLSLAILSKDIAGKVTDSIDGTSMKIDYVRVYKKKPSIVK